MHRAASLNSNTNASVSVSGLFLDDHPPFFIRMEIANVSCIMLHTVPERDGVEPEISPDSKLSKSEILSGTAHKQPRHDAEWACPESSSCADESRKQGSEASGSAVLKSCITTTDFIVGSCWIISHPRKHNALLDS